ncbi:uncharacterized protein LOC112136560 isoform X2 [Oryzias melastigma]|uniref:uncharacterized protein LOC112136560 isoform X2 n=1 Tax=Oryzias melastigma TaxID=30732 RepID=UPI000CF7E93B|nr:uncharacterized protein LOC112136560 isoform X2 [Oryzias melastigma]
MNVTLNKSLDEDEARVVENAIRLAVDSVLNVLSGLSGVKVHEYRRMVADRDKEIQRLERRLAEIERELQLLRRRGCTCELLRDEPVLGRARSCEEQNETRTSEKTDGPVECEMSVSLGIFSCPPSDISSRSSESASWSPPSRQTADPPCTSYSSETSAADRSLTPRSVKQEPADISTITIKWEEGNFQEIACDPPADGERPAEAEKTNEMREEPQGDPGEQHLLEAEQLRMKKRSVPTCELPEEAQRLKRAAWRAASRRYYARKIARQKVNPQRFAPLAPVLNSQEAPPHYLLDRRSALISQFPEESQVMQREAWRAASRRYYARKTARPQMQGHQFGHLILNPAGSTQGANGEGPHCANGGIMCS